MRVFYVFSIKNEIRDLYFDRPSILYRIFKNIYILPPDDLNYAKTLLDQLNNKIDYYELNMYLFVKLHREYSYSKRGEVHYINNLYKDEISKLIAKNRYIKIISESTSSSFFNIISKINKNYFVCDFDHLDFFFIDNIKKLV